MASIQIIKGSDGSGNANVATIQSSRSSGATTLDVDTVLGINATGFAGSMGTPHTFTDPITSETITVISEATAVDFTGHVDGSNLEIDDIAPGYVDGGSEVGDIVIIRPTTQWGDNVAEVLEEAHNDDGSLKDDAVTTDVIDDDAVTTPKIDDLAVTYAKLLATIFSGQIQTVANSGSAGGTWSYINLGGIRMAWCIGSSSSGTSAFTRTWVPPTSFFTTLTNLQATVSSVATLSEQYVLISAASVSSITTGAVSPGGSASCTISLFLIGT